MFRECCRKLGKRKKERKKIVNLPLLYSESATLALRVVSVYNILYFTQTIIAVIIECYNVLDGTW